MGGGWIRSISLFDFQRLGSWKGDGGVNWPAWLKKWVLFIVKIKDWLQSSNSIIGNEEDTPDTWENMWCSWDIKWWYLKDNGSHTRQCKRLRLFPDPRLAQILSPAKRVASSPALSPRIYQLNHRSCYHQLTTWPAFCFICFFLVGWYQDQWLDWWVSGEEMEGKPRGLEQHGHDPLCIAWHVWRERNRWTFMGEKNCIHFLKVVMLDELDFWTLESLFWNGGCGVSLWNFLQN